MVDREHRKKASEIFNESTYLFSTKASLDQVFPEIEDITVEVEVDGRKSIYQKNYFPGEYVNCKESLCYKGGFSIGDILRNMVRNKQTESEAAGFCEGYLGSPKGKVKYKDCSSYFKVKLSIKYRENILTTDPV